MQCFAGCGREVDRDDLPRYDVLAPDADLTRMDTLGPYCPGCFSDTTTGQLDAQTA